MSIADQISRLQGAKADIKTAIEGKGVSVPSSALLDSYPDYIDAIQQGGGGNPTAPDNDVIFIDYDGTIRYSYTAAEFSQLTEMPANPTHEGLTAQGWNWTLADAKAYVATFGGLTIGQMYVTDDGKTRLYIELGEGRQSPMLGVGVSGSVVVDWGDGTTETLTGTSIYTIKWTNAHNYAAAGAYVITFTVTGEMLLQGAAGVTAGTYLLRYASSNDNRNGYYRGAIKKVEIGANIRFVSNASFNGCAGLESITIPNSVRAVGNTSLADCLSLRAVVIPSAVTSMAELCNGGVISLSRISLPKGITSTGNTSLNNTRAMIKISLPPDLTTIGNSVFQNCYGLSKIIIPSGVTSIGSNAFADCRGMAEYHILAAIPPTLASTNAFYNIPADCKIYVPSASLAAYQGASNWSAYASQIYGE